METAYRVNPLRDTDPKSLGEYQLVGQLGTGGMGVVYLAESEDGTYVAIKLIHPALTADPEFRGRFRSEVQRVQQVPSFCTAEFLGADLDHDPPYMVVEYVDGPSLAEVVEERGPLRGGALHSLAVGVATALTGIHRAGVIHRDLKPDNVLLPSGSPKVIDFGIARPFEATSQHTRTDVMVGTVAYMAPERLSGKSDAPVTAAADVFAWGCVITYAGTGQTPFAGDAPSVTAARILTQPPRVDELPDPLRRIVQLALARDPADRPTASRLLDMLMGEDENEQLLMAAQALAGGNSALAVATPDRVGVQPVAAEPRPGGEKARAFVPEHPAATPTVAQAPRRVRHWWTSTTVRILVLAVGLLVVGLVLPRTDNPPGGSSAMAPVTPPGASATVPATGASPGPLAPAAPLPVPKRSLGWSTPPQAAATKNRQSPNTTGPTARPTAGPAEANPSGRDLALGRPALASSTESTRLPAGQAVDGDLDTRWGSERSDPQWLRVDLGKSWQISNIVLRWQRSYAVSYRVEISADGTHWTSVYHTSDGAGGEVTVTADRVPGRYVRMYGTQRAGQYGYSLYAMEVR